MGCNLGKEKDDSDNESVEARQEPEDQRPAHKPPPLQTPTPPVAPAEHGNHSVNNSMEASAQERGQQQESPMSQSTPKNFSICADRYSEQSIMKSKQNMLMKSGGLNVSATASVRTMVREGVNLQPEFEVRRKKRFSMVNFHAEHSDLLHQLEAHRRKTTMTATIRGDHQLGDISKYTSERVEAGELTWELNPWEKEEDWQVCALVAMFESAGCVRRFQIEAAALVRFFLTVKGNYNNPAFHNWIHAFSVCHAAWMMVTAADIRRSLTDLDVFAVLVASLCHDLDHPGVNNDFLGKTKDPLAQKYDKPVLENHHWALCQQILQDPGRRCDVTSGMTDRECEEFLETVYAAIMATDMAVHKEICGYLTEKATAVKEGDDGSGEKLQVFARESPEERMMLVRSLVHAADLSGQGMTAKVAYGFGRRVLQEFHEQLGQERQRRLPESAYMRDLHTPLGQAKAQLGFISFVLIPLWGSLGSIFNSIRPVADRIVERMAEIDFDRLDEWEGRCEGLLPHPDPNGDAAEAAKE